MSCTFTIPFSGEPGVILGKAKEAIEKQGGQFSGNENEGSFHVSVLSNTIAGSYTVAGKDLTLTITDKPFFLSCSAIEGLLRSKLS